MKNEKLINQEISEKEDKVVELFEHNTEDLKIWFTSYNKGKDLILVKYRGGLHTSHIEVLNFIEDNSDINWRYVGYTPYKHESIYIIDGKMYKVEDAWTCNDETRADFSLYTGKYIIADYTMFAKKMLVEDVKKHFGIA